MYEVRRITDALEAAMLWPKVKGWVKAALDKRPLILTTEDVRGCVLSGRFQLWTVRRDGELIAAAASEIMAGSLGKSLMVITCGGTDMVSWIGDATAAWSRFGTEAGCHSVIELGRKGWTRVLKRHGWSEYATAMIKVL